MLTLETKLKFKKLNPSAKIPSYATENSAGFDFYTIEDVEIEPGKTAMVKTGLSVEIPEGYFMGILPRSSTGLKTPLRLSNSMGVIDSDYRGEIMLLFTNTGNETFKIESNTRLAQGIIFPVFQIEIIESEELSETERGTGGFGSTGK